MAHELVARALDNPVSAEVSARAFIATAVSPADLAVGHQAMAISLRDQGRVEEAVAHVRTALSAAERTRDVDLLADVLGTSGGTLVLAGHPRRGLAQLDRSIQLRETPMALMRRAYILVLQGRHREAYRDSTAALEGFRAVGDGVWEARTLHNLGWLEMVRGRLDDAERHTREAVDKLDEAGLSDEALGARQNLGEIASARGDLAGALRVFHGVAVEYERLGQSPPHFATVRAQTFLAAGLVDEAIEVVREALTRTDVLPLDRAVLQLMEGTAQLDADRLDVAAVSALSAAQALRKLGDDWFATRARFVAVRARARRGNGGRTLATEAVDVAAAARPARRRGPGGHDRRLTTRWRRRSRAARPRGDVPERPHGPDQGQWLAGPGHPPRARP